MGRKVDLIKESSGMRGLRIALGLVGVFGLTATAAAADSAFYVGGGVGLYNAQVEHPVSSAAATAVGVNCTVAGNPTLDPCTRNFQDSAAVWDVLAGYQIVKWLAIQADYQWYQKGESQIPINSSRNFTVTGDSVEVSVKPSLALGEHFDIYVRLGWNWYNVDGKYQFIKGGSDSDDAAMAAGGVSFNVTPSFSIQAEYEYVDVNSGSLDATTLRAIYKFHH
jgi:opacity protein-like surface antigen